MPLIKANNEQQNLQESCLVYIVKWPTFLCAQLKQKRRASDLIQFISFSNNQIFNI